jgi:regulatory protein
MRLYRQTVEDFRLYSGMEIEDLGAIREGNSRYSAKMRAVRIISASNVSKRDLETRLVRKGESEEQAREAVAWLEDLNLVDDRATAKQIVERCIYKGYGLQRAKQALYEKQIPKALWEEALEDYPEQTERIADFLRSKLKDPDDPRQVKRAIDAALRRGHSYGDVKRALEMIGTESEFEEDY